VPTKWVDVLAQAYRLEVDETAWLNALLGATVPLMPKTMGAYAATYDASDPTALRIDTVGAIGFPTDQVHAAVASSIRGLAAEDVKHAYQRTPAGTASQILGDSYREKLGFAAYEPFGIFDTFGANAIDPGGRGCLFVGLLPRRDALDRASLGAWNRLTAHVAAARRLRRAYGTTLGDDPSRTEGVDAVLTPNGKVHHARNDEIAKARGELQRAVGEIERTRGARHEREPLQDWRAMVSARWSLVDHFERDGKRYLVAVRNEAPAPALADLTPRERQVVGFALLGHSNKVIAYELGLSASTVGVLLARALKRLGLRSRAELARVFPG
jgi:DNA-binding CsgD family transcriptional regulator